MIIVTKTNFGLSNLKEIKISFNIPNNDSLMLVWNIVIMLLCGH